MTCTWQDQSPCVDTEESHRGQDRVSRKLGVGPRSLCRITACHSHDAGGQGGSEEPRENLLCAQQVQVHAPS